MDVPKQKSQLKVSTLRKFDNFIKIDESFSFSPKLCETGIFSGVSPEANDRIKCIPTAAAKMQRINNLIMKVGRSIKVNKHSPIRESLIQS